MYINKCDINFWFNYGKTCYDGSEVCDSVSIPLPACVHAQGECGTVIEQQQLGLEWLEESGVIAQELYGNTEAKEQFMTAVVSHAVCLYRSRRGDMAQQLLGEIANTFIPEGKRAIFIASKLFHAYAMTERFGYGSRELELPKLPCAAIFVRHSCIGKYYF